MVVLSLFSGRRLPRLPPSMIPKVYGMSQSELDLYIEREPDGSIVIGGGKCLNVSDTKQNASKSIGKPSVHFHK